MDDNASVLVAWRLLEHAATPRERVAFFVVLGRAEGRRHANGGRACPVTPVVLARALIRGFGLRNFGAAAAKPPSALRVFAKRALRGR